MVTIASTQFIKTCPVGCNAEFETTGIVLTEGPLMRCMSCGQWISQCTEAQYWASMEEFNDPHGTLPPAQFRARSVRRSKKYLDRLSRLLGKSPNQIALLDVGCSSGAFLGAAVSLGYQAQGVEPAERAAATAQSAGLTVHRGLLHEAAYADSQFDAVTLLEVIEHLNEPLGLLKECQRILRPGGILLVGTANAASWSARAFGAHWDYLSIAKHGGHVSFFNPASLEKLTAQAGFTQAALTTRSVRFCDRGNSSEPAYTVLKIVAELVNPLSMLMHKGSDMAMYLRRT